MNNHFVRFPMWFATILLVLPLWMSSRPSDEPAAKTFTGEVTDSFCAKSRSHDGMMAKMQSMGRDKETCSKKCAEIGAKYVLYDESSKAIYTLDDQEKAKTFAGHRVRVAGTLAGNQIRVTNVEAIG
jgi:hypothetical protein